MLKPPKSILNLIFNNNPIVVNTVDFKILIEVKPSPSDNLQPRVSE